MLKDITLGRYFPGDSVVHRLDPRTKLLITIAYMVILFLVDELWVFALIAVFMYLATLAAQIPIRYILHSLRPLRWILIIMFVLNIFMIKTGRPLVDWWIFYITDESILRALFIIARLVLLIAGTSLMTLTTTPIALTDAIESLMKPLKLVKFPVHELAMMMTIALRFIPTLLDETDRIMKAQLARGADFETGGLIKRAKAMIPILIPLFVSAFKRADELAYAMDSRCYHGGIGRTRMKIMKYSRIDIYAGLVMVVFCVGIILIS
ncbi:MAG TPA: energy-coupling factor transporter transmembrane protein EcfT [Clostridiales bacterium]|jgi:energy-coupling factor transport system permease protein|nr:energy-coupling factor transporter transmembrane protein EcfT [Clostridiales bacterium]